jgi:apolipoprotein N-acyltransferase
MTRPRLARYSLATVGGILLSLAFPNAGIAGLAWIAPAIIAFSALGATAPVAFRCGFLGGLVFFLASLDWLLAIPYTFYGVPLAPGLGWIALSAYCAFYTGLWVWFCWRIFPYTRPALPDGKPGDFVDRFLDTPGTARLAWAVKCACGWVALELWRSWFLSGFPWNSLGASQFRMLPLIQIASFTGLYGVSFLAVWTSISLGMLVARIWRHPASRETLWATAGLPLITVVLIAAAGAAQTAVLHPPERSLKVALVQPAFPQTVIWDPQADAVRFEKILSLSRQALSNEPDLLIWPESGAPEMTPENQMAVARLLSGHKAWMVLCVDFAAEGPDHSTQFFNSSILLDPAGEGKGIYHKRRLVMFGEYIPFRRWLSFLDFIAPIGVGFTPGKEPVQFKIDPAHAIMSVLICFEDVFAAEAREHVKDDTDFLINLTNDGWFGELGAQWQQTACAVFRAIENGVPLVRCSNTGITCLIDARGRIREVLSSSGNVYGPGIMTVQVPLQDGPKHPPTFYNQHGDVFGLSCCAIAALTLFLSFRRPLNPA